MLIAGKMSTGMLTTATTPNTSSRIAKQTDVYGRRSARWTSHTASRLLREKTRSQRAAHERLELRPRDLVVVSRRDEAELRLCVRQLRRQLVQLGRDPGAVALALRAQVLLRGLRGLERERDVLFGEPQPRQEPRGFGARLAHDVERDHARDLRRGVGPRDGV